MENVLSFGFLVGLGFCCFVLGVCFLKLVDGFKCKHCPETFFETRKDAYVHLIEEHDVDRDRVNEVFDDYIHDASKFVK